MKYCKTCKKRLKKNNQSGFCTLCYLQDYLKKYYQKNKEKIIQQTKEYRSKHKEQIQKYCQEYRKKNQEYFKNYKSPFIICKECQKKKRHKAHSLCVNCYSQIYLKESRRKYQQKPHVKSQKKKMDKKRYIQKKKQILDQKKVYYNKNKKKKEFKEKRKQRFKRWYEKNKKKHLEQQKERQKKKRKQNPKDTVVRDRKINHKRRLKLQGLKPKGISVEDQKKVLKRDKICVYCGNEQDIGFDHIKAITKGGNNNFNNLVVACKKCNSSKGNKNVLKWLKEQKKTIPRIITETFK